MVDGELNMIVFFGVDGVNVDGGYVFFSDVVIKMLVFGLIFVGDLLFYEIIGYFLIVYVDDVEGLDFNLEDYLIFRFDLSLEIGVFIFQLVEQLDYEYGDNGENIVFQS